MPVTGKLPHFSTRYPPGSVLRCLGCGLQRDAVVGTNFGVRWCNGRPAGRDGDGVGCLAVLHQVTGVVESGHLHVRCPFCGFGWLEESPAERDLEEEEADAEWETGFSHLPLTARHMTLTIQNALKDSGLSLSERTREDVREDPRAWRLVSALLRAGARFCHHDDRAFRDNADHFLGSDQPQTCPRCGSRTDWKAVSGVGTAAVQKHVCLNGACKHEFIVSF